VPYQRDDVKGVRSLSAASQKPESHDIRKGKQRGFRFIPVEQARPTYDDQ
jgi:hypothetical protein